MSGICDQIGFSPELRRPLLLRDKAMSGDLRFVCIPASASRAATDQAWSREVEVRLETAGGLVHDWFDGSVTVAVADSSTEGTASIAGTTLAFKNGVAKAAVNGNAAAWAAAETDTFTVTESTILGYAVAQAVSVQTFTA